MTTDTKPALLALEDGTLFWGSGIGAEGETFGEFVFNTGMTGYQEVLTDPSYCGQIVVMTYPEIGIYGVNPEDVESGKVQVAGFGRGLDWSMEGVNIKGKKMTKKFCFRWLLVTLLFVCASCTERTKSLPTVTPMTSPGAMLAPSLTLPATKPAQAPSPTPLATARSVPTWTPSLTPLPVRRSPSEKQAFIESLLADNGGCEWPCWWGVTPGETSWSEVANVFRGLGLYLGSPDIRKPAYLMLTESYPEWGNGKIEFLESKGLIEGIHISADVSGVLVDLPNTYMRQFSPGDILARYGVPSRVTAVSGWPDYRGSYGYYGLWLEYADLGIAISYSGDALIDTNKLLVCSAEGAVSHIEVYLYPPGPVFDEGMAENGISCQPQIEEIFWGCEDISPEEFYTAFNPPASAICMRVECLKEPNDTLILPDTFSRFLRAEEDVRLAELMATDTDCDLPCWWGITPGITRADALQAMFIEYGKAVRIVHRDDEVLEYKIGVFGRHDPAPLDYVVSQSYDVQDGVVSNIHVSGQAPVWGRSQHLAQDWQRYSLPSALERFGVPSRILVHYDHQDCGDAYQLGVVYDEIGVLLQYGGHVRRENGAVLICPAPEGITRLGLVLTALDSGIELADQMRGCSYGCDSIPLEEITGMSPDIFYRDYTDSVSSFCLEVPERTTYTCP